LTPYDFINGSTLSGSSGQWNFATENLSSTTSLSQVGQLVQAMAGFGGGSGAVDGLNAGLGDADSSQRTFLTTPQHA